MADVFPAPVPISVDVTPIVVPLEPVICSDFENGLTEGWSFISAGSVSIPGSGGNPGRYLQVNDAGGISLAAPSSAYHGDWSLLDGHTAEIHNSLTRWYIENPDVVIVNSMNALEMISPEDINPR